MRKIVKIGFWTLAVLLALLLLVAAALYLFVDAEPYRDILQARLSKALDREVSFGEMKLSFLPAFGLRLDDFEIRGRPGEPEAVLLSANSLRAGARLLPLLKKRLEVTSIAIDRPVFTLHRAADGSWQPASLLAGNSTAESQETESGSFSVRKLRIRNGKLALRLESGAGLTLDELSLRLSDVAADGPFQFELAAAIGEMPDASIRVDGSGMMNGSKFSGSFEIERIGPPALMELLGSIPELTGLPQKLLGDTPFTASAAFNYSLEEPLLRLDNMALSDIALNLERDRDGVWQVARFLDELGSSSGASDEAMKIKLGGISLENGSMHIEDASAPLTFDLAGMKLSLGPIEPDVATSLELSCAIDTGAGKGRLAMQGTLGPAVDVEFELQPVAVGGLAALLPRFAGLDAEAAEVGAKIKVRGDF
jgi:uncharacterized protein involved in outer membrane biogenesis